jgi:hypothetical protein
LSVIRAGCLQLGEDEIVRDIFYAAIGRRDKPLGRQVGEGTVAGLSRSTPESELANRRIQRQRLLPEM